MKTIKTARETPKTAQVVDQARGRGTYRAAVTDAEFGSDFLTQRRKVAARLTILRVLAKRGRINMGRVLAATALEALPCAEAIAELAELGLVTMRRYPEIGCNVPLVDLMPDVAALNRVRQMIAESSGPRSLRADLKAHANIQARIEALEASHAGASH